MSLSSAEYMKCHGLVHHIKDAASIIAANASLEPTAFMAEYLASVIAAQHLVGRNFAFVAGTAHNRRMFMSIARRCLQPMAAAGPLTIEDYHNVLQLLCADCPGSMVKNAWSAATAVHAKATGTVQSIEDGSEQLVSVDALMHCLEITFLFEQYLMALRRGAFGADKTCTSMAALQDSMAAAAAQLPHEGWLVLPSAVMERAITTASGGGLQPCFLFRDLVTALCHDEALKAQLHRESLAAVAHASVGAAASHATALLARQQEDGGSDDDDDVPAGGAGGAQRDSSSAASRQESLSGSRRASDSKRSWR